MQAAKNATASLDSKTIPYTPPQQTTAVQASEPVGNVKSTSDAAAPGLKPSQVISSS